MAEHVLDGSITHPYWQRGEPPRLEVASGDVVVFHCPEPCGQVTPDWTARDIADRWDGSKVHALLGPVDVRGAVAGGSLDVEILSIEHEGWGWSALIPGFGLLHDRFPDPHLHQWALTERGCELGQRGIVVPFEPFCGCIGVGPEEPGRLDTIPPRSNGGNLDLRDAGPGSTVRLPVFQDGAGLAIGDGHAAQGDGELCGTAIEAPLTVRARLIARPDHPADGVSVDAAARDAWRHRVGYHVTTGVGGDVREAARTAAGRMLDHVVERYGLSPPLAMMLCSAVCQLRIAQAVNEPNWTIAVEFPRAVIEGV